MCNLFLKSVTNVTFVPNRLCYNQDDKECSTGVNAILHIEDTEQIQLFEWAALQSGKYPELALLFHIPNGGKRDAREAARFKRMGVKPGVPDLFLPVPRGKFHGLFVELKSSKGKLSDNQKRWLQDLAMNGYAACVCFGFDEAKTDIIKYLEGKL